MGEKKGGNLSWVKKGDGKLDGKEGGRKTLYETGWKKDT